MSGFFLFENYVVKISYISTFFIDKSTKKFVHIYEIDR